VAVAGGVARPKLHEKPVAWSEFVRRHRRCRGIRASVDLAYHLSMRRQAVQTRGSQARAEQQRETVPHEFLLNCTATPSTNWKNATAKEGVSFVLTALRR